MRSKARYGLFTLALAALAAPAWAADPGQAQAAAAPSDAAAATVPAAPGAAGSPAGGVAAPAAPAGAMAAAADAAAGVPPAQAAPEAATLDLHAALQEGLEHSPGYRRAVDAATGADWGRLEALSEFLPHVSLDGTRFFRDQYQTLAFEGLQFPEVYPYATIGFDASWTVFNGFSGLARLCSARLNGQAAGL